MKKFATIVVEHTEFTRVVVEFDDDDYPPPKDGEHLTPGLEPMLRKVNEEVANFASGVVAEKYQEYEFENDVFNAVDVDRLEDTSGGQRTERMPRPDGWAVERFVREFAVFVKMTPSRQELRKRNSTEVALYVQYAQHDGDGRTDHKWALIEDSIIDLRDADIGDDAERNDLVEITARVLDLNIDAARAALTKIYRWQPTNPPADDSDLPF